ncbi:MAG TPA: condensation domain-containing protein, partial [Acidimicrobiales bacterium]|nr:condensation domain-containing protein [Acidimicrobiales bacterium]
MNNEESPRDLSARMRELDPERRAALVRKLKNRRTTGPQRRPLTSPTVLSYEQERLWLLDQLTPGLTAYNASRVLHLEGPVNVNAIQRALNGIVERHEVLRTRVDTVDGAATPSIGPPRPVDLEVVDLETGRPVEMHDAITVVQHFLARPFDLSGDLLLRGLLLRLKTDDHVLALCVHHIASDGTSRQLLLDDLQFLYRGYAEGESEPTLEPPELQFSDVAAWQRDQLSASRMLDHGSFWTEYLAGAPPTIDLPFD